MRELVIESVDRPDPKHYFGAQEHGFLDWERLIWRFATQQSYWVATMSDVPHSMPVWGIWQNNSFRFSTDPQSRKSRNLRSTPRATVHLGDTESLFSLECTARELTDLADCQQFVDEYNPKYRWNFTADDVSAGLFELVPYKAFAWSDGKGEGFSHTATRWKLTAR